MAGKRSAGLAGLALAGAALVSACAPVVIQPATGGAPPATTPDRAIIVSTPSPTPSPAANRAPGAQSAARAFVSVIRRMEPAIERECVERRTRPINCNFQFVVDDREGQDINAFQTVDAAGRPIIGFTLALIAATRNDDELAFVVAHEASHHILNHLSQKSNAANAGAVILGGLATVYSGNPVAVQTAQRIGASVGTRYYSRDWELEADYLGSVITLNAGYDPRNGARFFERIPDPGNHVLGTHPARAQRIAQVDSAVSDVRSGRMR